MDGCELTLGENGSIVLPAELRARVGIVEGGRVRIDVVDNVLRIVAVANPVDRAYGVLREHMMEPFPTDEELRELAAQSIVDHALAHHER